MFFIRASQWRYQQRLETRNEIFACSMKQMPPANFVCTETQLHCAQQCSSTHGVIQHSVSLSLNRSSFCRIWRRSVHPILYNLLVVCPAFILFVFRTNAAYWPNSYSVAWLRVYQIVFAQTFNLKFDVQSFSTTWRPASYWRDELESLRSGMCRRSSLETTSRWWHTLAPTQPMQTLSANIYFYFGWIYFICWFS